MGRIATLRRALAAAARRSWQPQRRLFTAAAGGGGFWLLLWLDWRAWHVLPPFAAFGLCTVLLAGGALAWRKWGAALLRENCQGDARRMALTRRALASICLLPCWHWLLMACESAGLRGGRNLVSLLCLLAVFLTGLCWMVWVVHRLTPRWTAEPLHGGRPWHPLNLFARFYRPHARKLDQSMAAGAVYCAAFGLLALLVSSIRSCREVYEMPAGGGEARLAQTLRVQKTIRKKFVLNPFSAVLFNPPPIEEVRLQIEEITKHAYQVGQGQGGTAGFARGTARGKVRFIRLEYDGGDWDQDFGVGSDLNMLLEYGIRTGQPVASETESRRIVQLKAFPVRKSPPFLYITGEKSINASGEEVEILRDYLLEKHGMLFADNGGSSGWHNAFFGLMQKVLPKIAPVRVPLDHPVHRTPHEIPFLPYVAPHGGKDAWGWVVDGRLAVYYHPGDIGDAWADGHAGVKRSIWEYCYQLGVNVIFYAHAECNRWLEATDNGR